jgi:PKD repeat protein
MSMKRTSMTIVTVLVAALLLASLAPATALQPAARSLVRIAWQTDGDLTLVEASGVAVYARLESSSSTYLLAGATAKQVDTLRGDGLSVTLVDPDMTGASYYLVSVMPGRPAPDWRAYGRLLLDDGTRVLLRTPAPDAERLTQAGVEIAAVTLTPKPVKRLAQEGGTPEAVVWDPLVQSMIDQVTSSQVSDYDRQMAGELPVWVDNGWYTITSRYTYSGTPIQKATSWVGQHMAGLGYSVEYHNWGGATYPNVIGQRTGLVDPENIFIIGGHLDDVSGSPGADDNGSGSVATLLAADIMSQYEWGCTLRFAFWTGEEQGLNGSYAYAQRAKNNGENILGYLNLDMIAWNTPNSSRDIDLYYSTSVPGTLAMAQQYADVLTTYGISLIPGLGTGVTGSDHYSFWQFNYKSILGIEDNSDFNPYYHSAQDTPAHTDLSYFTDFVKASIADYAHLTGCLIPSGLGTLDGHVTAASGGAPIAGATVTITDPGNHVFTTTTDANGYYTKTLLPNTYTVSSSAYGYLPASVAGVVIVADQTTTQDFALQTAPAYTVQGTVTDSFTGSPLYAQVAFEGSPVVVATDPGTGHYQASLAQGEYVMHVAADVHRPQDRSIVVYQNQTQDFALEPLPCILLVDDDNDAPNTLPYFTAALDAMGLDYDVFDTAGGNGPDLAGLSGYNMAFWSSGDAYGGTAGPNSTDEANLAQYLDGGGRLFLSAQDYLYDFGNTTFGTNYLGIGSYTNDSGDATSVIGIAGDPVGGGLGPYTLTYPSGFTDYGDIVNAGTGASNAFKANNNANKLDVDKAGGAWKTVFFGTDWVPIYNNNAANGITVLQRIVDWFGGCEPPCDPPAAAAFTWTPASPYVGETVTFSGSAQGTPPISYAWDFGDGDTGTGQSVTHAYTDAGTFTVTMTASNECGQQSVQHTVTVAPLHSLHINVLKTNWAAVAPPWYKLTALARIHNETHGLATGATVYGTWTFPNGQTHDRTYVTDSLGRAKFPIKSQQCGIFQFCVTDITKSGYVYDPAANEQGPCRQVIIPCR